MKTSLQHRLLSPDARLSLLLLLTGSVAGILLSPKWLMPVAAWIGPACLLYFYRYATLRRKGLWFMVASFLAFIPTMHGVMPFPWFVLVILAIVESLKTLALYSLDRYVTRHRPHFLYTLFFPALNTVKEYVETQGDVGAWATIANSQYPFTWLIQLASVTGIWGITFLVYWFASVAVWAVRAWAEQRDFRGGVSLYAGILLAVLTFGAVRYYTDARTPRQTLTVGGVTVPNLPFLEALYQDHSGKSLTIDPKASQSSEEVQRAASAFAPFIQHPNPNRFRRGFSAMQTLQDSLFALSQKAVNRGARLVMWSEGNAMILKAQEPALVQRGQVFAARNRVYLLMAVATLLPGPITAERMFMENKTLLINPQGHILNTFHKNHPVPMAERSQPGDGRIPAIQTPYGTLAPSICYDADFIGTMRQLGQQKIGLLLLPSGDWYSISPYHSYMAVLRGIENGTSIARQVSGGLSLFTDFRGRVLASRNYFDEGEKLIVTDIPVQHVPTLYSRLGDWLAYVSIGLLALFAGMRVSTGLRAKSIRKPQLVDGST